MAKAFNLGDELRKAGGVSTVGTQEQIEYIQIARIDPDPENFYSLEGIDELAGNIELVGLQQPLRVRDGEHGHVIVVSGHRRRAACLMIRDGGSDMFARGVPCIRELGDVSQEWQELKLIYGNSATRILTASEISLQQEKTVDLLQKLEAQGVKLPGRTRDHVAQVLQTSSSRLGRLHRIRSSLVPELLTEFDANRLGETVAYRLAQEEPDVQRDLAARLGPAVRDLTGDSAEKVLAQIKQSIVTKPPEPPQSASPTASSECRAARQDAPPEGEPSSVVAIDGLKRYLDEREKEDREFWKLMQQDTADSLILRSFSAGAGLNRKDNIDMLRRHARNSSRWTDTEHWTASNKGLAIGPGEKITRTWTEVYDAVAAIAISRWRQVLVDERNKRSVKLKAGVPDSGTIEAAWQTGTPPREGRYYARIDMGDGGIHEAVGEYRGGSWSVFGGPLYEKMKVVGWWPLPEK